MKKTSIQDHSHNSRLFRVFTDAYPLDLARVLINGFWKGKDYYKLPKAIVGADKHIAWADKNGYDKVEFTLVLADGREIDEINFTVWNLLQQIEKTA